MVKFHRGEEKKELELKCLLGQTHGVRENFRSNQIIIDEHFFKLSKIWYHNIHCINFCFKRHQFCIRICLIYISCFDREDLHNFFEILLDISLLLHS